MVETKPDLMTLDEVAAELRINKKTLLNWRSQGIGPKGFRLGRAVVVPRDELQRWIAEQRDADLIALRAG